MFLSTLSIHASPLQVALVARGKSLEIVTNMASKRKTEVAVNFDRGERNFGSDAYALLSRKPKQTFTKITTLLGGLNIRHLDHDHNDHNLVPTAHRDSSYASL